MKTLSLSEAKMKLSALIETLRQTDEEIMITKNGRPAAVLVSPDEYDSWKETSEILSNRELMEEIRTGRVAQLTSGAPANHLPAARALDRNRRHRSTP